MGTDTIKCPNCGGPLHFEPEIQKNKCDYCLSTFTNKELEDLTSDIEDKLDKESEKKETISDNLNPEEHLAEYKCDSCGAEVVTEETTATTFCYYCHNPVILTDRITGEFRPDKVIPFAFSREEAINKFTEWAKRYKYVPKSFYSSSQLEKMTGIYIPYWLAYSEADVDFEGVGTNINVSSRGDIKYTEYNDYNIMRKGKVNINGIPKIALRKIDHDLLMSIDNYDQTKAVDFNISYLNGFFSEKYDIEKSDLEESVENSAQQYAERIAKSDLSQYDRLNLTKEEVKARLTGWSYILLPVWILTYIYEDKIYIYAVNGQNGESFGELPLDKKRLSINSILIAAVILIILIIGGALIW
ncbi:MAG: hypothetical protein Q4P34_02665 [Tissierellia bacterium]|nr:hypothetical protein [Tissierellia bacterium]